MTDQSPTPDAAEAQPRFAPKCIWCSAEWSDENVKLETVGAYCYESDSSPGNPSVQIVCHVCKRLMYEKTGSYYD